MGIKLGTLEDLPEVLKFAAICNQIEQNKEADIKAPLSGAFDWSRSEQGNGFWGRVYNADKTKLLVISSEQLKD